MESKGSLRPHIILGLLGKLLAVGRPAVGRLCRHGRPQPKDA
jgi:hypothetical protein